MSALKVNTVTSEEGATFTPWTDGSAIGFEVKAEGLPTRYVYLNPSTACDTGDILDSDVFLYADEDHGAIESICYVNVWDKED